MDSMASPSRRVDLNFQFPTADWPIGASNLQVVVIRKWRTESNGIQQLKQLERMD